MAVISRVGKLPIHSQKQRDWMIAKEIITVAFKA